MNCRLNAPIVAHAFLALGASLAFAACAASQKSDPFNDSSGQTTGSNPTGSGSTGSSGGALDIPDTGSIGYIAPTPTPGADGGARAPKCDSDGHCTCLNIASIGRPGITGFQAGMGGADSTSAFTDWLNSQSSAAVDLITAKPMLTADFLAKYDVVILQWLVDGVSTSNMYDGTGYWTFSADELAALKTWVSQGGGLITLSGYDASAMEIVPVNQVLQAVSDISYGADDVLGATGVYCLGESDPLSGWVQTTPIGKHVTEVGAFHGRSVHPGTGIVDCSDATYTYAAHEDVGMGHVFVYTDEWVTYTSQWNGIGALGGCGDASPETDYQVPQFWYNAISYAGSAVQCQFTINSPSIIH
jgi:hypothetical protein